MGKTLYRDPVNGKIAGVCAGIAEYFNLEIWLVRVVTVLISFIGFGFFVVIAYVAAILLIEKKPPQDDPTQGNDTQQNKNTKSPLHSPRQYLAQMEIKTKEMEQLVTKMEAYVTSSEFELNRKFKNL